MAATNKPGWAYRLLRLFARSLVRVFYSNVEVTGVENLDPSRPTLYAPTHPNSIIGSVRELTDA